MDTEDKVFAIVMILILLLVIGGFIGGRVRDNNRGEKICGEHAEIVDITYRYQNSTCQFQTTGGVWLNEIDYLLLGTTK